MVTKFHVYFWHQTSDISSTSDIIKISFSFFFFSSTHQWKINFSFFPFQKHIIKSTHISREKYAPVEEQKKKKPIVGFFFFFLYFFLFNFCILAPRSPGKKRNFLWFSWVHPLFLLFKQHNNNNKTV